MQSAEVDERGHTGRNDELVALTKEIAKLNVSTVSTMQVLEMVLKSMGVVAFGVRLMKLRSGASGMLQVYGPYSRQFCSVCITPNYVESVERQIAAENSRTASHRKLHDARSMR